MNDAQAEAIKNMVDGVDPETVFAPGGSKQLVIAPKSGDTIVADAAKLAADLIATYQHLSDIASAKLNEARRVAEIITSHATKMAEEANAMSERNESIGEKFMKVLDEHGITFDGRL